MESDSYKTIKAASGGVYKEKGSRFISFAIPIVSQDDIKPIIDRIRKENHDARHHCYAYMIGQERKIWRVNDDGEPSGTAGRPILGQINSLELTNILIVISRYFGGTLLGVSGLINAYRTAAADAISNAIIIECNLREYYELVFPYISMNDVMKILKEEGIGHTDQAFDLECKIKVDFRASARDSMLRRLSKIEGLKYTFLETR
jgi:uncharacterized YigZ family protein